MTPISDALTAAQRRALAAVEKAYVAGHIEQETAAQVLEGCGITDPVDRAFLFASLDVLREWGAQVPPEPNGAKPDPATEKMSDKQRGFIEQLAREKNLPLPELLGLSKSQASEVINSMQDGSYDPARWEVPF